MAITLQRLHHNFPFVFLISIFIMFFLLYFNFRYMFSFMNVSVFIYISLAYLRPNEDRKGIKSPGQQLQKVMSRHVGAEHCILVLCHRNSCYYHQKYFTSLFNFVSLYLWVIRSIYSFMLVTFLSKYIC